MGNGAHVCAGSYAGAEVGAIGVDCEDFKFFDLDLNGLQSDWLLLASQFIGGDAFDFLGGEWRRNLGDDSAKAGGQGFEFRRDQSDRLRLSCGIAFGVVGVSGEAEADSAFVGFFLGSVELREPREISGDKRKDAGRHRIEGAQVADGTFAENAAGAVDHVVRGKSGGLVDDEDGVHWEWCN